MNHVRTTGRNLEEFLPFSCSLQLEPGMVTRLRTSESPQLIRRPCSRNPKPRHRSLRRRGLRFTAPPPCKTTRLPNPGTRVSPITNICEKSPVELGENRQVSSSALRSCSLNSIRIGVGRPRMIPPHHHDDCRERRGSDPTANLRRG